MAREFDMLALEQKRTEVLMKKLLRWNQGGHWQEAQRRLLGMDSVEDKLSSELVFSNPNIKGARGCDVGL